MILWPHGILQDPDGRRMRQVPLRAATQRHARALWISEDGAARFRFLNRWAASTWSDVLVPELDDSGAMVLRVERRTMSLEEAIASAWIVRRRWHKRVAKIDEHEPSVAANLAWVGAEAVSSDEDDDTPWTLGEFQCSRGGIRDSAGATYRGSFDGREYVAAVGERLVPLSRDDDDAITRLPPSLIKPAARLLGGERPSREMAAELGLDENTLWSYFCQAGTRLAADQLRAVMPRVVSPRLWALLLELYKTDNVAERAILGGGLKELAAVLQARMTEPVRLSELRLARTCLEKMYDDEHDNDLVF